MTARNSARAAAMLKQDPPLPGSVRRLSRIVMISGLIIPALVGVVARFVLQSRGVDVVSWGQGAALLMPLTLLFLVPFLGLVLVASQVIRKKIADKPGDLQMWLHIYAGAFVGVACISVNFLYDSLTYSGPGGLAEVVFMMMALWMVTVPALLAYGAAGALAGGVLGRLVYQLRVGRR